MAEAVAFSAAMRLDATVDAAARAAFCDAILHALDLEELRRRRIGKVG